MKNLFLIMAVCLLSISVSASVKVKDYIVTEDGISYYTNVKLSLNQDYFICKNSEGELVKVEAENVKAYRNNGFYYEKRNLIIDGKPCESCDFMELVASRNDIKILKYCCFDNFGNEIVELNVFRGNDFVTKITQENVSQIISFFER
jgi:hypothetical protein